MKVVQLNQISDEIQSSIDEVNSRFFKGISSKLGVFQSSILKKDSKYAVTLPKEDLILISTSKFLEEIRGKFSNGIDFIVWFSKDSTLGEITEKVVKHELKHVEQNIKYPIEICREALLDCSFVEKNKWNRPTEIDASNFANGRDNFNWISEVNKLFNKFEPKLEDYRSKISGLSNKSDDDKIFEHFFTKLDNLKSYA